MPSNLDLKRSLEQARKELNIKNKEIAELNTQLSKFLVLEASGKVIEEIVPVSESIETEKNINSTSHVSETPNIDKKKKKRSIWNLYMW